MHTSTQLMESTARLNPLQAPDVTDTNIEHQPWFHFRTLRKAADLLVIKNGDFLVRESISQLGSYTLVVHWGDETVNFLISSSTRPDGNVKFRLTSDAFSTVPELIHHHLKTGYPVSEASPAVLLHPVDRQTTSHPAVAHSSLDSAVPPTRGSKGRNLTSRLSPACFSSRQLDNQVSDTHSAHYLQIMAVVKSILFSSKAAYIPQKLQQYTPAALAAHLTRHDLTLTQLKADRSSDRLGASGPQRLLMPYNDALRREVWFRHAQIKYLSILAVFGAVSIETRTSVISQLIALARELSGASLRNAFSFMSVMEALMSPQVAALTSTWKALREKFSSIMTVFDLQLKPLSLSYYAGTRDECSPPLIPYIQPVVYNLLIGVQDIQPEDLSQKDYLTSGLEAFLNHFESIREYTFPRDEISQLQRTVEQEKEDSSLTRFLQQNHTKTLLSKIDRKFVNDFELYDCAEILTSIISSLMTDY